MKLTYNITPVILKLVPSISQKIGEINANLISKPSPHLGKQNKIKTIHSSLTLDWNALTLEQVTALFENKRVIEPKKDVLEVLNAIKVYDNIASYDPLSSKILPESAQNVNGRINGKPGEI